MQNILIVIELIVSVALSGLILMQNKDGGLSATFGGGESFQAERRGAEKVIFNATIVLAVVFVLNALAIAVI